MKNTHVFRPICLVASLAALLPHTYGADPKPAAEVVTVTTNRDAPLTSSTTAQAKADLATVPGGASVVDTTSYQAGRASTYRDMLGWTPGVTVQPRFGAEESRLSIRGSGVQRTFHMRGIMLLQDGFALNQADGAGDFQAIEPSALEHIDIYRGANALQYGSATLGGAINFVSPTGRTAPLADLRIEGGSFGYVRGLAATGGQIGDADYYISASGFRQDGYRDHSEQAAVRVSGNLGYRFTDNVENRLYYSLSNSESELPGNLTKTEYEANDRQAALGNKTGDQKRDYPLYRLADVLAVTWGTEKIEVGLSWTNKDLFHPIFQVIDQYSEDFAGMARFVSAAPIAGFANRFTVGINSAIGYTNDDRFTNVGGQPTVLQSSADLTATTTNLYAEDQFHLNTSWAVILGLQLTQAEREYDDRFPANGDQSGSVDYAAANPKFGVLWQACEESQVYANISRSYEPPSFGELGLINGGTLFPTDLQAQSAWTAELGTRGGNSDASWELSLYHAWVHDELLSYDLGGGNQRTINADKTTHLGVEAGADITLIKNTLVKDDSFILRQVYNWGRFTFDSDPVYGNNQLPGLPEHAYRVELVWSYHGWYVAPGLEWQSGFAMNYANTVENDSFALLGARAGYQTAKGFSIYIEGRNLTDQRHSPTTGIANPSPVVADANEALYLPGDGLSVYSGVQWIY